MFLCYRFSFTASDEGELKKTLFLNDCDALCTTIKQPSQMNVFTTRDFRARLEREKQQSYYLEFSPELEPIVRKLGDTFEGVSAEAPSTLDTIFVLGTLGRISKRTKQTSQS